MYTKLLSLMISKLCHDLLNPVGVVRNSIAMLEEDHLLPEKNPLVNLLKDSNFRSLRLIKCYNLFFGSLLGVQFLSTEDLHRTLVSYFEPINLDWEVNGSLVRMMPKNIAQIVGQGMLLSENLVLKTHQINFRAKQTKSAKFVNLDFYFAGMDINKRHLDLFNKITKNIDLPDADANPSTVNMLIFWSCVRNCSKNIVVKTVGANTVNINFDLVFDNSISA